MARGAAMSADAPDCESNAPIRLRTPKGGHAMVETDIALFAANVSRIRREKKLSQSQVANRSGV
jgi:hypothetical protein